MNFPMVDEPMALRSLVESQALSRPHAVAIAGPSFSPIDYRQLFGQIVETAKYLRAFGLGSGDPVATVVGAGPQAATTFLAVAASANCVPLNPQLARAEFAAALSDLHAKAIVVEPSLSSAAVDAARHLGVQILEMPLRASPICTQVLTRDCDDGVESEPRSSEIQAWHVALTLHTSGTTSRPKQVPLTHANLIHSARNTANALALTPADRCLNVMPLFHIHALMAIVSSIAAGGSIVCASSADPDEFFACLGKYRPTWYTASPAIHQMIIGRIGRHPETVKQNSLRFIRSSSSALPERLYRELESAFNAPVIECYAMTEACYQISANPLPPGKRKIGSVGIAAGPELAIMDENGGLMAPKCPGEVVIRGVNVTRGYGTANGADRSAFAKGWFRTGDVGFLDDDGYLFLTGRLKDIVNKGGEKVSPREVEGVLLRHPAVQDAAVFAIFHPILGEDVAAAIVLREPHAAGAAAIQNFAFDRLAQFKVPQKIKFVERLPKNAAGKVQRSRLAEQLGFAMPGTEVLGHESRPYVAPGNADERVLAELWSEALQRPRVSVGDNFFDLGGYSLLGIRLCQRISQAFGCAVDLRFLYEAPTVEQQAKLLRGDRSGRPCHGQSLVPVRPGGTAAPFFWVHGESSNTALPKYLAPDQPLYSLEHQSHDGRVARYIEVAAIAAHYLDEVLSVQDDGPYFLGGYSFGGLIAFEMARQLKMAGREVGGLFLLDSQFPESEALGSPTAENGADRHDIAASARRLLREKRRAWFGIVLRKVARLIIGALENIYDQAKPVICRLCIVAGVLIPPSLRSFYILRIYDQARKNYLPEPYPGWAVYFESAERQGLYAKNWAGLMAEGMAIYKIPGAHIDLRQEPYVQHWAATLSAILVKAQSGSTSSHAYPAKPPRAAEPSTASGAGEGLFAERLVELAHEA